MPFKGTREYIKSRGEELYSKVVALMQKQVDPIIERLVQFDERSKKLEKDGASMQEELKGYRRLNEEQDKRFDRLSEKLGESTDKIRALEDSQQSTGILSGRLAPKGEMTFEDLRGLAREVSDEAYQKIQGFFYLEMAKKGFEGERPDITITDIDSNCSVYFRSYRMDGFPVATTVRAHNVTTSIENFPILVESDKGSRSIISGRLYETRDVHKIGFQVRGSGRWEKELKEDLPGLYQAYMLGYALKCLDEGDHENAIQVQKKHGLREDPALIARMAEVMQTDPRLATLLTNNYPIEE